MIDYLIIMTINDRVKLIKLGKLESFIIILLKVVTVALVHSFVVLI